jgi:hypothetical protein
MTEFIVAVGLLTASDLERLGSNFSRAYPVEDAPRFSELLRAIDEAERKLHQHQDEQMHAVIQPEV